MHANTRETTQPIWERIKFFRTVVILSLAMGTAGALRGEGVSSSQEAMQSLTGGLCEILHTEVGDHASNVTIYCEDGRSAQLTVETRHLSVMKMPSEQEAPLGERFVNRVFDPNYNCHSYTFQQMEDVLDIDLGIDEHTWTPRGIESFVEVFGTKLMDIPFPETEESFSSIRLPYDPTHETIFVALYSTEKNGVIHSAVIIPQENGTITTVNKFGEGSLSETSLWYAGWKYYLNHPEMEGSIAIYELKKNSLPVIESVRSIATNESNEAFSFAERIPAEFVGAFRKIST